MTNIPSNLKYTETDEWFDPATGKIGLSDYAQSQLSDIVFVEILVEPGDALEPGKAIASVESVKASAEVYSPRQRKGHRSQRRPARQAGIHQQRPLRRGMDDQGGGRQRRRHDGCLCLREILRIAGTLISPSFDGETPEQLMTYIPHSPKERDAMLATIGVKSLADLFEDVPAEYRFPNLDLPPALTEMEAAAELAGLADANSTAGDDLISFLGAGAYNHYIPAAVDHILRRGEFYTAYTPYQPEISQGTLQAIFEYQSLMTALTGMEVSNASHYDGATAVAEAVNMAYGQVPRQARQGRHLPDRASAVPRHHPHLHPGHGPDPAGRRSHCGPGRRSRSARKPDRRQTLPWSSSSTRISSGASDDFTGFIAKAHAKGALVCVAANPTALALFKTPGAMGADIVVGEGQPLGIPLSFGGPYLGFFTTRKQYVHKMAGRLVGETVD